MIKNFGLLRVSFCAFALSGIVIAYSAQAAVPEGVVSVNLGPAVSRAPVAEADWNSAVVLDHFLNEHGGDGTSTPTKAWLAWDEKNLYVRFWCADPNAVKRGETRLKRSDHVEVYLRAPDAGLRDFWKYTISAAGEIAGTHAAQRQTDFQAQASQQDDAWIAQFTIPWTGLGGRPARPFGLQIARLRDITDEILSPSALDPHDGNETSDAIASVADQYMETSLGGQPAVRTSAAGLVTMPSGIQRWVFPSRVEVADTAQRKTIWNLQQQLSQATSAQNFSERLRLAGQWYYLLMQEAVSFHPTAGQFISLQGQLYPWAARQAINEALRTQKADEAYPLLDSLLKQFDQVTRGWFADESPGSVRDDQWTQLDTLTSATVKDRQIELVGTAGKLPVNLTVSFPAMGGVRVNGAVRGFFAADALAFKSQETAQGLTASAGESQVEIQLKPRWSISVKGQSQTGANWVLQQGDLAYRFAADGKVLAVDLGGAMRDREQMYGFGERFDRFSQRGNILSLWQMDAWDATVKGGLRNESYKTIPFWFSTRGYSAYWNSSYRMRADIGCSDPNRYRLTVNGPVLDLFVWPTKPQAAINAYTTLTGKPILPPLWAFEAWAGGGGGRWGRAGNTAVPTQIEVMKRFRDLDIPHSGLYAEGAGSSDSRLYAAMEPMGIHVFTWHRSQVRNPGALLPNLPADQFPVVRSADGTPFGYPSGHPLAGQFPYIDFTSPHALEIVRAEWRNLFDLGVTGSMIDFGDLVPPEAVFHDGTHGDSMHNFYAYGYHRVIADAFRERRGDDFVIFARGGAPGSQAFVENFVGDHPANYPGLKAAIVGSLTAATAAFSNYGSDLGGYHGTADEEVYMRWVEWSAFSALMRAHGQSPREPWFFSDAAVDVYKQCTWARENLLDYIDNAAQIAHQSGVPIMQSLALAYPDEPTLTAVDDEYMFGPDLLVAPVCSPGEQRDLILPPGKWTSLWDGSVLAGGTTVHARVRVNEIPVFLRSGSLVPIALASSLKVGESMTPGRVEALLTTPPQAATTAHQTRRDKSTSDYTSEPTAAGFRVSLASAQHVRFLIVSGVTQPPTKVALGGVEMAHLQGAQQAALPPGWYLTEDDHRLVVRLPQNLNQTIEVYTH